MVGRIMYCTVVGTFDVDDGGRWWPGWRGYHCQGRGVGICLSQGCSCSVGIRLNLGCGSGVGTCLSQGCGSCSHIDLRLYLYGCWTNYGPISSASLRFVATALVVESAKSYGDAACKYEKN